MALPRDTDDVVALLRAASSEGWSLVPRGAGTGMPGHNVGRGVLLDLSRHMSAIGPVDREARAVDVQPGAVAARVAAAAEEAGLYFPALPSSAPWCTVGGMVANNAAGARSFLHGAMRAWVVGLEVVLAGGEVVRLDRPERSSRAAPPAPFAVLRDRLLSEHPDALEAWPAVRKNASGYDLPGFLGEGAADPLRLIVGSEGTLGVVTSVRLRLVDPPSDRAVALLGVPRRADLPGMTRVAEASGASACEYFGRRILEMAALSGDEEVGPLARHADGLLLLEFEGDAEALEQGMRRATVLASDVGGGMREARSPEARERFWDVRHRTSPTIAAAAERGLRSMQFIEDCVVPRDRLPEWLERLEAVLNAAGTDAVVFGHAGDGNLHVNPLVDLRREDWRGRVRAILDGAADRVAELGGTLTGEHGDGRVRAPYLERIWGSGKVAAFRTVKATLDPEGRLNPGVILPLPGQDPLEGLDE